MSKVSIWNYGNYSNSNYGSSRGVTIGELNLYFSYDTVVAFSSPKTDLVISQNDWGNTTGKHLNFIDNGNKKERLNRHDFEEKLNSVLKYYNLY